VRAAVEFIVGRGEGATVAELRLTPRSKKVIELAIDEAQKMSAPEVGSEHILLGLLREGEGIAAGVLESLGIDLKSARSHVLRFIDPSLPGAASAEFGTVELKEWRTDERPSEATAKEGPDFRIVFSALIGPEGLKGRWFSFVVCTPSQLAHAIAAGERFVRGYSLIVVDHWDEALVVQAIRETCAAAPKAKWPVIERYLSRFGRP
jgi:hypothetical protein